MWPSSNHSNASICKNFRNYFREYCNSTSIHGFRYFGEKRTYVERIWWFIVFVICLSGCVYFIFLVYNKWENSPVIVSFSTKETPIYKIPFPAVTICPETKSKRSVYSHSDMIRVLYHKKQLTVEEYKQVSYMSLICDFNLTGPLDRESENQDRNIFDNYSYGDNEFFDFLYNVTPEPYENFITCKWMKREYRCSDIFQTVITDEGICYSFNMLENSEVYKKTVVLPDMPFENPTIPKKVSWNMDEGYPESEHLETYPSRALFSGAKNALYIVLGEENKNIDHTCKLSHQGFKVTVHTPTTIPRPTQEYFRLPLNQVVIGAIQPVMISTSDTVKMFKPAKRNCYFQHERPLKFFQRYTQHNCNLECLTNFTDEWCGCVSFFMPRENWTDICGALSEDCAEEAEDFFQKKDLSDVFDPKHKRTKSDYYNAIPDCDCLPLCSDLSYNIETSSSQWDWLDSDRAILEDESKLDHVTNLSVSNLIIYFKNPQFVTSNRHELYGPTDFLGNFGGLLGLFTGFSILSLMEIIYFLTVRIFCNIKLYGHWSGSQKTK